MSRAFWPSRALIVGGDPAALPGLFFAVRLT